MNKTPISHLLEDTPTAIACRFAGASLFDSSCSPTARVIFIDADGGVYLKRAPLGSLETEAAMTSYFHTKGLGAQVLDYLSDGAHDWLLTTRVRGEDATHASFLSEPRRLCDTVAEQLRHLHTLDTADCPIQDRTERYLRTVDEQYRRGRYSAAFMKDVGFAIPTAAYEAVQRGREHLRCDVLLHGDYCLPNIMLNRWQISGFIDVGCGGIGDRHIDIFWGIWSLWYNLRTDAYTNRFLDAYGRDVIDCESLRTVAAAEIFG